MKSLLFIGAALMAGAGIYGFVDYKKKEQNAAFNSLYKEEKPVVQQPVPEVVTSPAPTVVMEKKEVVVKSKKNTSTQVKRKPKKFLPKQFSRAIPEDEVKLEEVLPSEEITPATPLKKEL